MTALAAVTIAAARALVGDQVEVDIVDPCHGSSGDDGPFSIAAKSEEERAKGGRDDGPRAGEYFSTVVANRGQK